MFKWSNIFPGSSGSQSLTNKDSGSSEHERRMVELCAVSEQEAIKALHSTPKGLSAEEAERRLDKYGANELAHAKELGFWGDIFRRCKSPLVVQLLVIAALAGLIGEAKSAVIVGAMVVLSVGLSYILDHRSSRAVETLGKRVQSRALVLRDGKETEIKITDIVPGDIVLMQAGSIVPADVRLLVAKDFFLSQSSLTGESMPVEKSTQASETQGQSAWELVNACYLGSSVTSGSARGLVVNTGTRTLFGSIFKSLGEEREKTSFDIGVRSFTWLMIRFMIVMTFAVFIIVGMTKGNWTEALLFALSIAVGLTPEMLPMIVTVNLAKGALAMAAKKVIIKRLPSIQNFGAIDILCTDKTGTLTQDQVVLERYVDITGRTSEDVLNYAYLNSHYQTGLRNLIDHAILDHSDLNVESCRLVDELPFDFQRRRMSVIVDYDNDHVLICKGAVEEVYDCCSHYTIGDEVYPLFEMIRDNLFEEVDKLNRDGFRVLAIAYREFPQAKTSFSVKDESELILLGYVAFFDPPKASATEALELLDKAGVRVKVLTGDNGLVTQRVCTNVGLKAERVVTGSELSKLAPQEFSQLVQEEDIFVKLSPAQKEQIVRSLREAGHVVGFMGDGINDTPPLKAADVGISVDSAVDIAKESSDIILLENSLLVLEQGVLEGRRVFANIVMYIR